MSVEESLKLERERRLREHEARVAREEKAQNGTKWPKLRLTAFEKKIVQKFALGVKLVCGLTLWQQLTAFVFNEEARDLTEEEMESRFRIGRTSLNKGRNHGQITLDTVVLMLSDLNRNLGDLNLPERDDRFLKGYQEALDFVWAEVRPKKAKRDSLPAITVDELLGTASVLYVLSEEESTHRKLLRKTHNADDWTNIAREARDVLKEWSVANWETARPQNGADAELLKDTWGDLILHCFTAIPTRWYSWSNSKE